MMAKIFRILGVVGFITAMGSLSACFVGPDYPAYPRYSYGSPAYAYHGYYPRDVPAPRYYAYNRDPYPHRQRWEHKEHEKHEGHEHHHDRD
jgi:hypothetical protein